MTPMIIFLVCIAMAGAVQQKASPCSICSKTSSYIVGGTETGCFEFPFICSLQTEGWHFCGGSLVKSKQGVISFVTAAHCVEGYVNYPHVLQVKCVIHDRFGDNPYSQTLDVGLVKVHGEFNPTTYSNDVAILKLTKQPQLSGYIEPVKLATRAYTAGEYSTVVGWGATSEGGTAARCLMKVSKPVVSLESCQKSYGSGVDETMLCAGYSEGGKDACQGDSGGPLVIKRPHDWELVGIVSWGYGCARPGYPGVYTNVHHVKGWIEANL